MSITNSPPRVPPIKYTAPLGTRWEKEKAAAGRGAFDLPEDPKFVGPWIIGECVGKGASGRVKIAKHRTTGQLAAVKILPIGPLVNSRASLVTQAKSDKQRLGIDREITMMKLMNHPNIMRIYDVYEGKKELFLVLEYIEGGELFDFLVNRGRLPPLEALAYFKQIVYGLNYAHTFSIIHRDLKPENILIHSLNPPLIKIADWGMAAFAPPALQLETSCGSPHYASPEIVNGEKYEGNATDIWSCGVILYALLTGRLPFDDKNVRTLLAKVKTGKYDMPSWIDPQAKDLLTRMLVVDVSKRATIPEILAHPWLRNDTPGIAYVPAPSPSLLALPLPSPAHVDPDLLESLRVIWGRHADTNAENIRRDLLSPMGKGILAKAFYFLLAQYKERVQNGDHKSDDTAMPDGKSVMKQYIAPPSKTSSLHPESQVRSHANAHTPPLHSPRDLRNDTVQSPAISGLAPPMMSKTPSSSSSHTRTPSPVGPRPFSGFNPRQPDQKSISPGPVAFPAGPRPPTSHAQTQLPPASPRRTRPTRGYTQPSQGRETNKSSVPFPHTQTPSRDQAPTRPYSIADTLGSRHPHSMVLGPDRPQNFPSFASPATRNRFSIYEERPISRPSTARESAVLIHSPVPVSASPEQVLPLLTAPQTENAELQKTMNDITDRVNGLLLQNNANTLMDARAESALAEIGKARGRVRDENVGKENKQTDDGGWNYVNSDDAREQRELERSKVGGLGLGKVGREMGNIIGNVGVPENSGKPKDKKGRPPTTDFRVNASLNKKRSTMSSLGSPIILPGAATTTATGTRLLGSPAVGEFKGWFSNLFNWKAHPAHAANTTMFYSYSDPCMARMEVQSVLEPLGVRMYNDVSGPSLVLRCRVDEGDSPIGYRALRFRAECTPAQPGDDGRSPQMSTPNPNLTPRPSQGYTCAITLVLEKGSAATFRAMLRRLRGDERFAFIETRGGAIVGSSVASPSLASEGFQTWGIAADRMQSLRAV